MVYAAYDRAAPIVRCARAAFEKWAAARVAQAPRTQTTGPHHLFSAVQLWAVGSTVCRCARAEANFTVWFQAEAEARAALHLRVERDEPDAADLPAPKAARTEAAPVTGPAGRARGDAPV